MRGRSLVMAGVAVVLLTTCGGSDGDDGASSGGTGASAQSEVTIALEAEPQTLDPQGTQDGQMRRVAENIFERLIDRSTDDPTKLVPRLASALPEQVDDVTWTVAVRDDVTFTNGESFNAEVAAAAITRMLDPEYDSDMRSQIQTIVSAEATDPTTLTITTDGPDPLLPARLYMVQMVPMTYAQEPDFAREPVGTGPYQLVEWVAGDHIVIERNPDYWGDQPTIERATFRFLPQNQSRVAALQADEVDLATGIAPESAADVPQQINREGMEFPYLRIKNYDSPFEDEQVREALARALNIPGYVESIYLGNATQAPCQPNSPAVFGFNPDLEPYSYDPDRASELLDEAGYDGTPIRFTVGTGRWLKFEELSEAIAADLEAAGFDVEFELMQFEPWTTDFRQEIGQGQPDLALSSTSNELLDADRVSSFIGESGSVSSYIDPDLEADLAEARTMLDVDEREAAYHAFFETMCDEVAGVLPLLNFQDIYGASEALQWTPRFDGTTRVDEMSFG